MIIMLVDSTYGVIISTFQWDVSPTMEGVEVSMSQESYIDGKETIQYAVMEDDIPEEIAGELKQDPSQFVYSPDEKFKRRPRIIIDFQESEKSKIKTMTRDGSYVVPINEPIGMEVRYYDPDNVGFLKEFEEVKMKDRDEFINVPKLFKLDDNGTYQFNIESAYPGICTLRAKDTKYICEFRPISIRFKQ